jgi:hypothetical protein
MQAHRGGQVADAHRARCLAEHGQQAAARLPGQGLVLLG